MRSFFLRASFALAFTVVLSWSSAGQSVTIPGTTARELAKLVRAYTAYYAVSDWGGDPDYEAFSRSFENENILLPYDLPFRDKADHYLLSDYMLNYRELLPSVTNLDISADEKVMYGRDGNAWYAWVRKSVDYKDQTEQKTFNSYVMLRIVRAKDQALKIADIKAVSALPPDSDNDRIADPYDDCLKSVLEANNANYIALTGCDASDEDRDGVRIDRDSCPCVFGKGRDGCPTPPPARYALSFSLGTMLSVDKHFNSREAASGDNANNSFFAKSGYTIDIALRYHAKKWGGIGGGLMFMNKKFDEEQFRSRLDPEGTQGANVGNIRISAKSYQFFVPYAFLHLRLSGGNSERGIVSFEPIVALSLTDLGFLGNTMTYEVLDSSGPNMPSPVTTVNFKTNPFLLYGGRLNMSYAIGQGLGWLTGSVGYMTGKYGIERTELYTVSLSEPVIFEAATIHLLSINIGVNINLHKPKNYDRNSPANRCP